MTDTETLDRARQLFVGDTQGDRLARDVIRIAERFADTEAIRKAGDELREEMESTSEECMSADTARLKDLSDRCGGWWVWDEEMGQPRFVSLATWPVIQRAKQTFVLDTPTERLAREVIEVAERATRKAALREYEANQSERDKGIHFTREDAQKLRALAEYCMRGYMGEHAHTVNMILEKVPE